MVTQLLDDKQKAEKVGGIKFYYQETGVGIEVLLFPDSKLSISFSINRKIKRTHHTDIDRYLERFLLPLEKGVSVKYFEFSEVNQ